MKSIINILSLINNYPFYMTGKKYEENTNYQENKVPGYINLKVSLATLLIILASSRT